jgi:hypothetical protein
MRGGLRNGGGANGNKAKADGDLMTATATERSAMPA